MLLMVPRPQAHGSLVEASQGAPCRTRCHVCCRRRGVVLEALGRFDDAVRDYRAVLDVAPNDPAGWNNLGNALAGALPACARGMPARHACARRDCHHLGAAAAPRTGRCVAQTSEPLNARPRALGCVNCAAGLGKWGEAVDCYSRAAQLAPAFAFASANRALALYQLGQKDQSIRCDHFRTRIPPSGQGRTRRTHRRPLACLPSSSTRASPYLRALQHVVPGCRGGREWPCQRPHEPTLFLSCCARCGAPRPRREMRALLRKYPNFVDMRAGLAAALWGEGLEGDAESNW